MQQDFPTPAAALKPRKGWGNPEKERGAVNAPHGAEMERRSHQN